MNTETHPPNDLLLRTLRGEATERRPLWIMRQAGRYLPEYRKLKESHSFLELSGDPRLAAEVTMMPFARFPLDGAIVFADIMSPIAALGVGFDFAPGPVVDRPIRDRAAVEALPEPDPAEVAPEVYETLRIVRRELAGRATLLGFAGAPLTLAAYLVQGHGKSDFPRLRALASADPETFSALLAKLARLVAGYLQQQVAAGAQAVQVFDSWGGLLSLRQWRSLVRPHLVELLTELKGLDAPKILFLNNAPHLIDDALELPWDALAVDWRADLPSIRRRLGHHRALQGNLDPAVLLAGPEATRATAADLLARMPARGHVVNLGHGITPEAPIESVEALVETVRGEGSQPARETVAAAATNSQTVP
ncbi:MAG: uroporphyrinogen decarboxylase [Holophagales bacterium]|nr:uroporphyrinogen decarboxylase [Holophagales bacterium]